MEKEPIFHFAIDNLKVGERIKTIQNDILLKNDEMAELLGYEKGTYAKFVAGKRNFPLESALSLEIISRKPVSWIYLGTENLIEDSKEYFNPIEFFVTLDYLKILIEAVPDERIFEAYNRLQELEIYLMKRKCYKE